MVCGVSSGKDTGVTAVSGSLSDKLCANDHIMTFVTDEVGNFINIII